MLICRGYSQEVPALFHVEQTHLLHYLLFRFKFACSTCPWALRIKTKNDKISTV